MTPIPFGPGVASTLKGIEVLEQLVSVHTHRKPDRSTPPGYPTNRLNRRCAKTASTSI